MNFKLYVIFLLIFILFVNCYLFSKKIENFVLPIIDVIQTSEIGKVEKAVQRVGREVEKADNDLAPVRVKINDVNNQITEIDNKIKRNNTLSLAERNSNRIRNENNRLNRQRRYLINYRNRLRNYIRNQRRIIRNQGRTIRNQRSERNNLKMINHILRLKHNGLAYPGFASFYDKHKRHIYTIYTNKNDDNFKNDNNPILRRACYCKASPGFKVALFTNRNQNSKEKIVISGGPIKHNRNDLINLRNEKINNTLFKRTGRRTSCRSYPRCRRWWGGRRKCKWKYGSRQECKTTIFPVSYYKYWCGHTQSVKLERIIDNNYGYGIIDRKM